MHGRNPGGRPRKPDAIRRGYRLQVDLHRSYGRRIRQRLDELGNPDLASFVRRCLDWGLRHEFDGADTFNLRIQPDRDEKVAAALLRVACERAAGAELAMDLEGDPKRRQALSADRAWWLDVAGWCEDVIKECVHFRRTRDKGRSTKASHDNFHPDVDTVPPDFHSS
ncbi:MAG: hypothetical protein ACYCT1_08335 [Steroidobacteraceae bacterium]